MDNRFKNKKLTFTLNTRHTPPLTDKEKKVIVALVDHINPNNKNTNVHSIASSILLDRVDKIDHSKLKKLLISLMKKTVEISRGDGGFTIFKWISHIEFIEQEYRIEYSINPQFKPYLMYEIKRLKQKPSN